MALSLGSRADLARHAGAIPLQGNYEASAQDQRPVLACDLLRVY
jgi:hypothetical protein